MFARSWTRSRPVELRATARGGSHAPGDGPGGPRVALQWAVKLVTDGGDHPAPDWTCQNRFTVHTSPAAISIAEDTERPAELGQTPLWVEPSATSSP